LGPHLSRSNAGLVALAAAALAFAVVLFAPQVLNDGDTYWHIVAGRWMLDNRAILRIDPFSYTFMGHPWQTHEWLSEILMALAYVGAGWNGIVILFAAAAALTAGLLARHLSRWLGGISLILTLALALFCVSGSLLTRPHLLALPLLELWTAELVFARSEARAPSWKVVPLMVLWANLHASFLVGLGLMGVFTVGALLERNTLRPAVVRGWLMFAAASFVAACITPYGVESMLFPFKLMGTPMLQNVTEWAATDFREPQPLTLALAVALFVMITRGVKVRPLDAVVLLVLLALAVLHVRHHMLIAIVAPLLLAEPLATALDNRGPERWNSIGWIPATGFAVALALLMTLRFVHPLSRGDDARTPMTALTHVPLALSRQPVLNDYAFGGYLIFKDVHPFIDSRVELYGNNFLSRYAQMMRPDTPLLEATLSRYHVRWTILAADNPAVRAMDEMKGWHRLYADDWAVVHVRNP
jgi:hypothetical protein